MEAIIECAAGLDVHQATVVACVVATGVGRKVRKEIRTFGTMTRDLDCLRAWLSEHAVTLVGMESTGVYWMPVYAALEGSFTLIVGNAHHIRNVPGRKTDAKDAEWLAELVRYGLIRPSFVPAPELRELRDLLRHRRSLAGAIAAGRNRTLKLLESAGIKLSTVATDAFGVSGMAMLHALADGVDTPEAMAALARGRLRRKLEALARALEGRMTEHHRFMLRLHLVHLEHLESTVAELDARITEKINPYHAQVRLLAGIPGVDQLIAAHIIAEIGVDMSVFGTAGRLAAWAGVCPGNYESAGKRRGGATRKGNVSLKTALITAAIGASRTRGTYLKDKFYRLRARCGANEGSDGYRPQDFSGGLSYPRRARPVPGTWGWLPRFQE